MFVVTTFSAFAYDFSAVAPSGQTLYYNIVSGNAEVTFQNTSNPYYSAYPTGSLVIPTSVTYGGTTYSVTSIGDYAFRYCSGLTSVTIGNSVTSIGEEAFIDCDGLTSVTIGSSVTSIGSYAFTDCYGLTSVTIPNSVTSIGIGAFSYCSGLTSVTIPDSVTSIGIGAFACCSGLTSIVVEAGNTHYDSRDNCNAIIRTELNHLVQGCNTTVIPSTVTSIGEKAFLGCRSLTSITIPNSVTSIDYGAFSNCDSLTSVTIGNSVTSIGEEAFLGCRSLTSITIPNSVTSIGDHAFSFCDSLTSVTIGNSVTSIGRYAFGFCYALLEIHSKATVAPLLNYSFEDVPSNIPVHIPQGSLSSYETRWSYFFNFIEDEGSAGVEGAEALNAKVYSSHEQIVVEGADGNEVTLLDLNGRQLATKRDCYTKLFFDVPASGTYLIKIGNHPARKVVAIR